MTIYLARALASVLFALAMLLGTFAMVDAAHAYRPHPGMRQPDVCKNIKGKQTIGDIIYRKYTFDNSTRRPNDCKRVRR